MVMGSFEPSMPKPPKPGEIAAGEPARQPSRARREADAAAQARYPIAYTIKIAATVGAMLFVLPGYRQFPLRVSPLAIVVGVAGVVLWIWLCRQGLERKALAPLGLERFLGLGDRPAYNPLEALAATPVWAYTFLAIRFFGLAFVVPVIEEFFLRGFLMRFVVDEEWWKVPFGQATPAAIAVGTIVPMLMHPGELLAAAAWFSLVTWLMIRTRNIWDCVAAHAVTNLLLGLYVVTQGEWQLW
jgi:CAAX prenyl protease-like protein